VRAADAEPPDAGRVAVADEGGGPALRAADVQDGPEDAGADGSFSRGMGDGNWGLGREAGQPAQQVRLSRLAATEQLTLVGIGDPEAGGGADGTGIAAIRGH
jgi:hypothetical protein